VFAGTKGKFMDVAALIPIVEGAGGIVTDLQNRPHYINGAPISGALISNGLVHEDVLRYLKN
jgi:fructose-1,6-bisphosphatase/inositol monophosphatase family enzyme